MQDIAAERIVKTAREWLGTKFAHKGMVKKIGPNDLGGCDCMGLVIGIAADLGLAIKGLHPYDIAKIYQNHKTISAFELINVMSQLLTTSATPTPGNIVVFAPQPHTAHAGIVSKFDNNTWYFINANKQAGMVVEQIADQYLLKRVAGIFCF